MGKNKFPNAAAFEILSNFSSDFALALWPHHVSSDGIDSPRLTGPTTHKYCCQWLVRSSAHTSPSGKVIISSPSPLHPPLPLLSSTDSVNRMATNDSISSTKSSRFKLRCDVLWILQIRPVPLVELYVPPPSSSHCANVLYEVFFPGWLHPGQSLPLRSRASLYLKAEGGEGGVPMLPGLPLHET